MNTPQQYDCRNIDLLPSHFFNEITTIGDVRSQEQMDRGLQGADVVILLAAQHRDDISPVSLYYDTNVGGMEVTLKAMEKNGCKRIIFFSSVAVYGLDKPNPAEDYPADPFNHSANPNGRQSRCCRDGTSHIRSGTSTSCALQ